MAFEDPFPITQTVWIESDYSTRLGPPHARQREEEPVQGQAIAAVCDLAEGRTLFLVVRGGDARPVWVRDDDLRVCEVR